MKKHSARALRVLAACIALAPALASAADIIVGQVAPLSGLEANQGRAYAAGMQLYFNAVSKTPAAGGHAFTLVRKDDGGRPEDTLALTKQMLAQERPTVLAGYFGNRNVKDLAASGVLEKEKVALVGYRISEIRPEHPMLFSVRAGLRDEIGKLAEHLGTIGITRLGLFYEDGPGAAAVIAAAEDAAKKANAAIVNKASYPAGTAKVSPAVEALTANAPQAIIMIASGSAAAAFIETLRAGGSTTQLFAHSGADIEQLAKRLAEEQMQGVAIAQVTPSPYKISVKLAKEFNDAVAKDKPEVPVSYAMIEGYIAAKVIVEAARRQGARVSREGMVAALNGMDSYDLGGYMVGYRRDSHAGSKFVELSIISGAGRIRQ